MHICLNIRVVVMDVWMMDEFMDIQMVAVSTNE